MVTRNTRSAAKPASTSLDIDFTGVESRKDCPDGEYTLKVLEVTKEKGDVGDYLKFKWTIGDTGAIGYDNKSLATQSLWSLKQLLELMGFDVPEGKMQLDLKQLQGEAVGGVIGHEEYQGKMQIRITDFFALATGETAENDGGDSDLYDPDEVAELGEDELADIVKKHKLGVKLDDHPSLRKKKNAVLDALEAAKLLKE